MAHQPHFLKLLRFILFSTLQHDLQVDNNFVLLFGFFLQELVHLLMRHFVTCHFKTLMMNLLNSKVRLWIYCSNCIYNSDIGIIYCTYIYIYIYSEIIKSILFISVRWLCGLPCNDFIHEFEIYTSFLQF